MTRRFAPFAAALILLVLAAVLLRAPGSAHAESLLVPDLLVDAGGDGQGYVSGTGAGTSQGQCTDGVANGNCTLREAIRVASADSTLDVIGFSAAFRIRPNSALPLLTDDGITIKGLVIDGVPVVHLDGSGLSGGEHGLRLHALNQTVRNLVVYGFPGVGVKVNQARRGAVIEGSWIGVAPDSSVTGNGEEGVLVTGGHAQIVGNTVSGNGTFGVHIAPGGGSAVIVGNTIGLGGDGATLPNASSGVSVDALDVRVGTDGDGTDDEAERNVISGNGAHGVEVHQTGAVIAGNSIGTDATGSAARGNASNGILIEADDALVGTDGDGSADEAERNVISGNDRSGVEVGPDGANAVIAGNTIGTDAAGTGPLRNTLYGIHIRADNVLVGTDGDGTGDAAERNVISGHQDAGVFADGEGAIIAGNYIGTDASGAVALGNGFGIDVRKAGARIGTDGDGIADEAERNVISGNDRSGIHVHTGATDVVIAGNYIGTDATGSTALGNGESGLWPGLYIAASSARVGTDGDGTADEPERNVISGNSGYGVQVLRGGKNVVIAGNHLGVDAAGEAALPNGGSGVSTEADSTIVGTNGDGSGDEAEGNVILGGEFVRGAVEIRQRADDVVVAGNAIGITPGGTVLEWHDTGVWIGEGRARVGTNGDGVSDEAERNVIVGHAGDGVFVDSEGEDAVIAGNSIGVDLTGTPYPMPHQLGGGVQILAPGVRVGTDGDGLADETERNVISGGGNYGVNLTSGGAEAIIAGNYIGTDATGTEASGGQRVGVQIDAPYARVGTDGDGSGDEAERNVISGNETGVEVGTGGSGAVVAGNYIGTDASGTAALGNDYYGLYIGVDSVRVGTDGNGSGDEAERNVISGHDDVGIYVTSGGAHVVIAGNHIGTDASGSTLLRNGGAIRLYADHALVGTDGDGLADEAERNVISGNGTGVLVEPSAQHAVIAGNYIGTDATGTSAFELGDQEFGVWIEGSHARVGTSGDGMADEAERNVIAGNFTSGIFVFGSDAVIAGNYVGTNASGTAALGFQDEGIRINAVRSRVGTNGDGVGDEAERNVISGNQVGINVRSSGRDAVIAGNYIGTDAGGLPTIETPYHVSGVSISAVRARVGTDADGTADEAESNVIAGNDGGIGTNKGDTVILGNSIHANSDYGIGRSASAAIPVITSATTTGASPGVSLSLASTASTTFRIEVFANAAAHPSGFGEGERLLGVLEVTTDASGDATGFLTTDGLVPGEAVSATATPITGTAPTTYGGTSEFSRAFLVPVLSATLTGSEGWRMLAAPASSWSVGDLLGPLWTQGYPGADAPGGFSNVWFYDETAVGGSGLGYITPTSAATPYPAGAGIMVYVYQDDDHTTTPDPGRFPKTLTGTGTEPSAPFTFTPSFTDTGNPDDDGWNLLGNPFAASLDWDATEKTRMSDAVYVWDPENEEYLTWNGIAGSLGSGVIAPYQAFWAKAWGAAPSLTAPEASRIGGGTFHGLTAGSSSGTPAKTTSATDVVGFRVSGEVGGRERSNGVWATFTEEAERGLDRFDAYELASAAPEALHLFWRLSDGTWFDIAALPASGETVKLPLEVSATGATGPLTLTWPRMPTGWRAVLIDKETRRKVNLLRETSYTFELDAPANATASRRRAQTATARSVPTPRVLGSDEAVASKGAPRSRFVVVLRPPQSSGAVALEEMSVDALLALGDDAPETAEPLEATVLTASAPVALALAAPSPNPSRGAITLGYDVPESGEVSLVVVDALGREVVEIARGTHAPGRYSAQIRAGVLAPGTYGVVLRAGRATQMARFTVVR